MTFAHTDKSTRAVYVLITCVKHYQTSNNCEREAQKYFLTATIQTEGTRAVTLVAPMTCLSWLGSNHLW